MRSFQDHFSSLIDKKDNLSLYKPVLRSSAIFPFVINDNLDTKITFLSYWFLKRKISEVSVSITLRDKEGLKLFFFNIIIKDTRSYEYSVREILNKNKIFKIVNGSIEIEINSTQDMVFPFPAITVSYVSKNSNAFVHTCGRIFNDLDDKIQNTKVLVAETGFDVLPNKGLKPFFSFVNGPNVLENQKIKLHYINSFGETLKKTIFFKYLKPYSTQMIFFLGEKERNFFKKKKGTLKIDHDFKDFFSRFMCGALEKNYKFSTLTHSYYDLSNSKNKKIDFWKNPNPKIFFDSSTSFPIYFTDDKFTEFVIYPNFIQKKLSILFELFSSDGENLHIKHYQLLEKKMTKPIYLNLTEIFLKKLIIKKKLNQKENFYARASTLSNGVTPTRLKFGLNIGQRKKKFNLTSNICFNANVPTHDILNKKKTFKWSCIFYNRDFELLLSNFSYLKSGFKEANLKLTFWDQDGNFYTKKSKIFDNGFYQIKPFNDKKIKKFLKGKNGWVTIEADNPFVSGFYVNFGSSGIVGADHIF